MKKHSDPLKAQQKRLRKEAKAAAKAAKKNKTTTQLIDDYEVMYNEVFDDQPTTITETIDDLGTEAVSDKASKKSKPKKSTDEEKPKTAKQAQKELLKSEALKKKPKHQKGSTALAFKEFPVKMVKEVSKIHWSGQKNLWTKFIQVVLFILIFAALFYLVDLAFQELFTVMKVI